MKLDIESFMKGLIKQYIEENKNYFSIKKAFLMLDLFENSNHYTYTRCNDELIELINSKFLYFKNNYELRLGVYPVYFNKKIIPYFKVECFIISVILHDNINTFILFKKDAPLEFKMWLYNNLKYITILNKKNFKHISSDEERLIKSLNPYALIGIKDISLKSLDDEKNDLQDIIIHLEKKLKKVDERFKEELIRVPIRKRKKPFSRFDLYPLVGKLKQNRKAHNTLKKELDGLYESFYEDLRYESEYEKKYFEILLFQNKDDFIDYENFKYSPINLKSINKKNKKKLDKNRSSQLIKLVYSLH